LVEIGKRIFYRVAAAAPSPRPVYGGHRHLRRRAAHFTTAAPQRRLVDVPLGDVFQ
jgi:Mg2+-importing ATPase